MKRASLLVAVAVVCALAACGPHIDAATTTGASAPAYAGAAYAVDPAHRVSASELAAIGRAMFFDASLSASGRVSCASCHDPAHGHAPANALPVQLGGRNGNTPGLRNAPTLRYLQTLPPFSEHHHENEGDDSVDAGPTGGHMWDGRAGSAHEQASLPLLSPFEMANASPADFVQRLSVASYAQRFRAGWGDDIFARPDAALQAATMALEVYEQSPAEFQPFSSKYDAVLRGQAVLSAAEARGLAAFDDPARGNCASCHPSAPTADGAFPRFTDFGLVAIGVPRNRAIPANADAAYVDLGLCGPLRTDLLGRAGFCGRFRTPTLRNVAARQSFFHNGVVHDLGEAVRFYATRDTDPAHWYGRDAGGAPRTFDDLPARYRGNVERGAPFGGGRDGKPSLSERDIADIVAFLRTLTDADVRVGR